MTKRENSNLMTIGRIDTDKILDWQRAQKVKHILAKPVSAIVIDKNVSLQFLVRENLHIAREGVMLCAGISDNFWQWPKNKLLSKHNISDVTTDGWLICTPKIDNEVEVVEATLNLINDGRTEFQKHDQSFYIYAQQGTVHGNSIIQVGDAGDWICRSLKDSDDTWIIRKLRFDNTYLLAGTELFERNKTKILPFNKKVA